MSIRYPDVHVRLVGGDGNAFAILARVRAAMRGAGVPVDEVNAFTREAMGGDYDTLLLTCTRWVGCDPPRTRLMAGAPDRRDGPAALGAPSARR
ncbi:MAG: hypothetical protein WA864_31030 [Acetobacteraceae bacterium]|jgi:hypothetical protein